VNLDQFQLAAVEDPSPLKVVAAGPGSGKTHTLVEAIRREAWHTPVCDIVVITYTTAAAKELQVRLAKEPARMPNPNLNYVGTLHGYLFRLLRRHGSIIGLGVELSVADEDSADELLKATASDLGCKEPFSNLKALAESPKDFWLRGRMPLRELVVNEFLFRCRAAGMLTFPLILAEGLRLLAELKSRGKYLGSSLFYDEAQDGAEQDFRFILESPFKNKFVVGDPDQSIYGFRGSRPDLFVALTQEPGWKLHKLECNYRSRPGICTAVNHLIEQNENRVVKVTLSQREHGVMMPPLKVVAAGGPSVELAITHDFLAKGFGLQAVLCRTNREVKLFADYLRGAGIKVREQVEEPIPPDWRLCRLLLAALAQPWNNHAVRSYVAAKESPKVADKLRRMAETSLQTMGRAYFAADFLLPARGRVTWDELDISLAAEGITMESRIKARAAAADQGGEVELARLIMDLSEGQRLHREEGDGVTVCTVHAAKGREWDEVAVVGCEERRVVDLEEARRLFYVAVTRAKERVLLTWCKARPESRGPNLPPGPMQPRERSRFVTELGL
jgi:DNA helicase-2/ATP-dependent DNA helicase PcrA